MAQQTATCRKLSGGTYENQGKSQSRYRSHGRDMNHGCPRYEARVQAERQKLFLYIVK